MRNPGTDRLRHDEDHRGALCHPGCVWGWEGGARLLRTVLGLQQPESATSGAPPERRSSSLGDVGAPPVPGLRYRGPALLAARVLLWWWQTCTGGAQDFPG
jgi:hypothetical protein